MATDVALQQAIQALRAGDRVAARAMLHTLTADQPSQLDGWLWLAAASDAAADKHTYLQRALNINPADPRVLAALRALNTAPTAPTMTDAAAQPVAAPAIAPEPTPSKPPAHPLAAPRFVATGVRTRSPIAWRLVALLSLLLVVAIPLLVLFSS